MHSQLQMKSMKHIKNKQLSVKALLFYFVLFFVILFPLTNKQTYNTNWSGIQLSDDP